MKIKRFSKSSFKVFLLLLIVFSLGAGLGAKYLTGIQPVKQANLEKNTYKAFISEIYDKIKENYWNNISDAELLDLFKLSIEKNGGSLAVAKFTNKDTFLEGIAKSSEGMNEEQKNKFYALVASTVLASLQPASRSGLFTQKNEEQLKNTVENINPEKDLYKDLGLAKGASEAAVQQAFQKKEAELSQDKSPQAQEKLKTIAYAKDTLTKKESKENYDSRGVEPTISAKVVNSTVLYVQFKKFSPTSLDEFQKVFDPYKDDAKVNSLILDLRGNVGGAIDSTAYFLGYFLGKSQYAFDFYHKGEYLPFKTATDKLGTITKYKQVVVLIDQNTQSSAEILAASLKKYHAGVVLGAHTKGWGTVERVFPLDNQISKTEKYSLFLVHSLTLRDDNLPIEGRGVEPDINISDTTWPQKLLLYFNNPALGEAVKEVL